jgi:hypothetical protein
LARSKRSVNLPPFSRASMMLRTAPSPTPFTAARPKRMRSPATAKSVSDSLTSGGMTVMPVFFASSIYSTSLSVLSLTDVMSAVRYGNG